MKKQKPTGILGKVWYFIWDDNSIWSWIVNIILAYLIINFIVYPGLGFILGTTHPVVSVMSSSMEHKIVKSGQTGLFEMCGNAYSEKQLVDFGYYWEQCGSWYERSGITKAAFSTFPLRNGFNRGDLIILRGAEPENLKTGDIIVFKTLLPEPIIHRVISKKETGSGYVFQTKGDHNAGQITNPAYAFDETSVSGDDVIGRAFISIPMLGYIKIGFAGIISFIR